MKRFYPVLLVFGGWFIGQFIGTPEQVYAQGRVSLASLQATIDAIINGNQVVGKAEESLVAAVADNAANADMLNGFTAADFALETELSAIESEIATLRPTINSLQSRLTTLENEAVRQGDAVRIGNSTETANASNAGLLRWNGGVLQVSNGSQWLNINATPPLGAP